MDDEKSPECLALEAFVANSHPNADGYVHIRGDYSGANLAGLQIIKPPFHNIYFAVTANFSRANLTKARFEGCRFTDCDFSFANLSGAILFRDGVVAAHCNFSDANMQYIRLNGMCEHCNFNRAQASWAQIDNRGSWINCTAVNSDFRHSSWKSKAKADFRGADLSYLRTSSARSGDYFGGIAWTGSTGPRPLDGANLYNVAYDDLRYEDRLVRRLPRSELNLLGAMDAAIWLQYPIDEEPNPAEANLGIMRYSKLAHALGYCRPVLPPGFR